MREYNPEQYRFIIEGISNVVGLTPSPEYTEHGSRLVWKVRTREDFDNLWQGGWLPRLLILEGGRAVALPLHY